MMMSATLRLRVVSQRGKALAGPLSARFDQGGSIGRSPDCTLSLPDPNRHISREQARISAGAQGFQILCTGSASAILVNGVEVGPGETAPLRGGDSVIVAEYEIAVEEVPTLEAPGPGTSRAGGSVDDPLAALGVSAGGAVLPDPLAGFGLPPVRQSQAGFSQASTADPLGLAAVPQRPSEPLPASIDSLDAMFDLAGVSPDPLRLGSGLAAPLSQPNTAQSADPLASFGMNAALAPRSAPDTTPEITGTFHLPDAIPPTDFGFGMDEPDRAGERPAHAPEEGRPAAPPRPAVPAAGPVIPFNPVAPVNPPIPAAPFLSWQQDEARAPLRSGDSALGSHPATAGADHPSAGGDRAPAIGHPAIEALAVEQVRQIANEIAERHRVDFEPPPSTRPTDFLDEINRAQVQALHAELSRQRAAEAASRVSADPGAAAKAAAPKSKTLNGGGELAGVAHGDSERVRAELLAGLLKGLGLPELPRSPLSPRGSEPSLSPELMTRLGELIRVGTQGAIDLLQTRATLKREMKTEVTMIASRDNNPLKFSPDAAAALAHLLSTQSMRGFLEPVPALKDSFDDLLAHQVGFVAGMRAAMQGLIARFDPASLEARLVRKSVFDSMLPGGRRARLWELFSELFADISREAEDDFEALFGREFVRAYEEQIASLKRDET